MSHFATIADAEEAGAPGCFSDEFAYYERTGQLAPGGSFPIAYDPDPDPGYWERDDPYDGADEEADWQAEQDGQPLPPVAESYACTEGDDAACPTATCGCPPF